MYTLKKIGDKAILTPVMKKEFYKGSNSSHLGRWDYPGNNYEYCYIKENTVTAYTSTKTIEMPYSIIGNGFEGNTKRAKWYDKMNSNKWKYNDFRLTTGGIILTFLEEPSIFTKID